MHCFYNWIFQYFVYDLLFIKIYIEPLSYKYLVKTRGWYLYYILLLKIHFFSYFCIPRWCFSIRIFSLVWNRIVDTFIVHMLCVKSKAIKTSRSFLKVGDYSRNSTVFHTARFLNIHYGSRSVPIYITVLSA